MTRRGPHHIGTTGAVPGDALVYDPDADEYAPGPVVQGLTSTDLSVTITDNDNGTYDLAAIGGGGEVLMADGVASPPVPIETEAGDDWLYSD